MAKGNKITVSFAFGCDACGTLENIQSGDALCAKCKPVLAIRPPTKADGLSATEVAQWHDNQRVLAADARTAGGANRPTWLVERVLADARAVSQ